MKKAILFDLDGTLTDSGEGIMNCAEITLRHYGLPVPTRQEMRSMVGPPLRDSLLRYGIPPEELDDAVVLYRKHYMAVGRFENAPYPGIRQLLERLEREGYPLYIATSKPEHMARGILEHFDLAKHFRLICGAAADGVRNTKDAVIEYLLGQLEDKQNLVMVGDTVFDVLGANVHGIPTIGVSWGYGITEDMRAAGAIGIANTMDELYALVTNS